MAAQQTRVTLAAVVITLTCLAALVLGLVNWMGQRTLANQLKEVNTAQNALSTQLNEVSKTVDNTEWVVARDRSGAEWSPISIQVGTIQFLKNGFSVSLDDIKYAQEGLVLSGAIGNPKTLLVHGLVIQFRVVKPLSKESFLSGKTREDRIMRLLLFATPDHVGKAETTPIGELKPGGRAAFKVTVPNVKQGNSGDRLEVSFSGVERYSYPFE